MIKTMKPLVMMQLKDKIDLTFLKSKKQTISKIVITILAVAIITTGIYFAFWGAKLLKIFSLISVIPVSVIVVIFTLMQVLSIISCTYGLMKTLYFAKDNQILLTLPVNSNMVFFSKTIVYYIYELLKNLYFLIPLFVAYGLICGFSIMYYPWIILCFIIISALPVCIGALLSVPCMYIVSILKKLPITRLLLFAAVIGFVIYAVVKAISLIPANLDIVGSWGTLFWEIQTFLKNFTFYAFPFAQLVNMLVGTRAGLTPVLFNLNTLYVLLCLLCVIGIIICICYLLSRPLFFKMASKPFEYKKKLISKQSKNNTNNKLLSALKKEFLISFRTPETLYNVLSIITAVPILILLLNKLFAAMSTRLLGQYMTLSFNLLIILLIVLASNNVMASIISKEGAAGPLIKTRPTSNMSSIVSKMLLQSVLVSLSIISTVCIFAGFANLSGLNITLLFFTILFVYIAHVLWSTEMDIMNPQYQQYATTGSHVSNPNETKSSVTAFFLSFLFFGLSLFLFIENINVAYVKLFLIATLFFAIRIYLFVNKVRVYYMEK